jgi:hypothetical protein
MNELLSDNQTREIIAELAALLPKALGPPLPAMRDFPALVFELDEHLRGRWEPVFTGGGIVSLLLTDPAAPPPSRTKDVDLVLEIASYAEFAGMEMALRSAGFTQTWMDNAPIVAWRWKGVRVDFLPHKPIELMQTNRWFPFLIEDAERVEVMTGQFAWRASAPCFLATKFEAFFSRGRGDYVMSKDIEDIIAIVDGRPELVNEIQICALDVRGFVAESCRDLLAERRFMDCLPQIVPDDAREMVVTGRLKGLADSM